MEREVKFREEKRLYLELYKERDGREERREWEAEKKEQEKKEEKKKKKSSKSGMENMNREGIKKEE